MARLPIQNTARGNSEWTSEFYVRLFSLAPLADNRLSPSEKIRWMAENAKTCLPNDSYASRMYAFVQQMHAAGYSWEQTRDSVYERYQVNQMDGYDLTSRQLYCNGCFASGINFSASLISLFYGAGDLIETIKIGTLCGWDSDNPTATWGGLLGFMLGKSGIEKAFNRTFSGRYNIHRTRVGFPNNGVDSFDQMAQKGIWIIDRVVQEELGGYADLKQNRWHIPIQ
jgi:hypothetical protein